jgi:hypothetical protein
MSRNKPGRQSFKFTSGLQDFAVSASALPFNPQNVHQASHGQ